MPFLLISGNSNDLNLSGAIGKSYEPIQGETSQMDKETLIPLDNDIVNLENWFKTYNVTLKTCQSTKHKKDQLKTKPQILNEITHFARAYHFHTARFYFSGRGYVNGDCCVQTKENPNGERLKIEQIIQALINYKTTKRPHFKTLYIMLDSSYSGSNIERAIEYLLKEKPKMKIVLWCSTGPLHSSITTQIGSLLIGRQCKSSNPLVNEKKGQWSKKFQARNPVELTYIYQESYSNPRTFIKQLKF